MTITHPDAATTPRLLDRLRFLESRLGGRDLGPERLEAAVLRSELFRRGVDPDADDAGEV